MSRFSSIGLLLPRLAGRGMEYLDHSLYHFYFLAAFLVPAAYGGLSWFYRMGVVKGWWIKGLAAGVILLTVVNAHQAYALNSRIAVESASQRDFIQSVDRFVKRHAREPGFSFDVLWRQHPVAVEFFIQTPSGEKDFRKMDYAMYFPRYVDKDHPAYYLVHSDPDGLAVFRDREQGLRYVRTLHQELSGRRK